VRGGGSRGVSHGAGAAAAGGRQGAIVCLAGTPGREAASSQQQAVVPHLTGPTAARLAALKAKLDGQSDALACRALACSGGRVEGKSQQLNDCRPDASGSMGATCPLQTASHFSASRQPFARAPPAPAPAGLPAHLIRCGGKAGALEGPGRREGRQVFVVWIGCHQRIVSRIKPVAVHCSPQRGQCGCRAAPDGQGMWGRHISRGGWVGAVWGWTGVFVWWLEVSPAIWHDQCSDSASLEGVGCEQTAQGSLPNRCSCLPAVLVQYCFCRYAIGAVGAALPSGRLRPPTHLGAPVRPPVHSAACHLACLTAVPAAA
jgi:hypothetical protein